MKQPQQLPSWFFFGLFLALKFGSHATKGVSSLNYKYSGALFVKHFSGIILRKVPISRALLFGRNLCGKNSQGFPVVSCMPKKTYIYQLLLRFSPKKRNK